MSSLPRHIRTEELPALAAELEAGDRVLLSGTVYTARDAAHKRFFELLDRGAELPFELKNAVIYYAGPTPGREDMAVGSCGPTTSGRMDPYTPRLLELGLLATIGKGVRSGEVVEAMKARGGVYFAAVGGAGALIAGCVKAAEVIAFEDLGCESVKRLTVEELPLTVAIDARGVSLYETGPAAYRT